MQFLSDEICRCDSAADIAFTAAMAVEGIKVVPTICALLNDADSLFMCISHKVILQELIYLPCIYLEVGAA